MESCGTNRVEIDGKRFYQSKEGSLFPSVTSVLGVLDGDWVADWKNAVGEERARQISEAASTRGTAMHDLLENYILGTASKSAIVSSSIMARQIIDKLDQHVTIVRGVEMMLHSDALGLAGTCDLLAMWDGKFSLVDYKSSNKPKRREDIHSYFAQVAAYSMMVEERYGIECKNLVILIGVDGYGVQVYEEERQRDHVEYLARCYRRWSNVQAGSRH